MKHKILSFLTAFAMVFGIIAAPFVNASAADDTTSNPEKIEVNVHKILMNKTQMEAHDSDKEYKPTEGIQDIQSFFGGTKENPVEELSGVWFIAIKEGETGYANFKNLSLEGKKQIVEAKGARLAETKAYGKDKYAKFNLDNGTEEKPVNYKIYEVEYKSTYKSADGKVLTNSKAVPIEISLPNHAQTETGVKGSIHVYPKNTEDKPKIDKNFAKAKTGENELEEAAGFDKAADGAGIGVGALIKNYEAKKATAKAELGKKIPYEVKTEIPAQSKLELAKWDDKMTDGLTYNKDLTITIGETTLTKNTDYTISETDSGFVLRLTEEGLKLVNGKEAAVTVVLAYSATVNKDAIIDMPEKNDVKFHYGNNPSNENDPKPGKPNTNGELKVEKTWDDGVWAEGESATFELRDAETGRKVTADELVKPDSMSDTDWENAKKEFNAEVTIGYPGKDADGKQVSATSAAWKYLNTNKNYIAVEIKSTTPSDVEYVQGEDGTLKATNHKSTNPTPLNPTSPQVVLGGKKFVKTNEGGTERLAGAEFYIKNSEGKYLVAKDAATETANKIANAKASEKYKKAIEDYKAALKVEGVNDDTVKITVDEKEITGKTAIEKKIDDLYSAYEKAFTEDANKYEWGNKDDAIVLVSDADGRFEIKGLEYGKYVLEEKSAPAGYAKIQDSAEQLKFEVKKGSYSTEDVNIKYNTDDKSNNAKQIENKKVTIPQTGGIGSIIFVVAGLMIMGLAAYKMKANKEQA